MSEQGRETEGGRVVLFLLLGLVVLFGAGYAAAHIVAGDNVPRGTTIAGVEVGGRSQEEAVVALQRGLSERSTAPIPVSVDGATAGSVDPETAGLAVDYAASVEAAGGGRSWAPDRLWDYFTGGEDLDPVVTVDEAAMTDAVDELIEVHGRSPRDGDVVFDDGRVDVVEPRLGESVDADEARAALEAAYLQETTAELTSVSAQPDVDGSDVAEALEGFANPALSAPVTLVFDRTRVRLGPSEFAPALSMKARRGELVPDLDEDELLRLVERGMSKSGTPVDATVRIVDGRPRVIPDKPGVRFRPDDVERTFLRLLRKPTDKREAAVDAKVARADFRTADARKLGIREQVSAFTTYFPHAAYRNTNIGRAAALVDGTILKPGETFSLNDTVGERTRANGFTEGFIIEDGVYKEDLGGGVSQMATTTFNAMFFAGLEDIEHQTHSFYIDRYPVGREATVAWGSVDLRFRNDTPYGVLITAAVTPSTPSSQGVVTVRMWSTDYWDITASTSDRYDFTPEKTRRLDGEDCVPNDGYSGFDVDVTRHFRRAGQSELHHDEQFHTTYVPSDTVICE
ncbi:MAG TPA: VanW family protein [Intrasporangium sp.]|nr:VanW family protein [Intrasporangium sp.]